MEVPQEGVQTAMELSFRTDLTPKQKCRRTSSMLQSPAALLAARSAVSVACAG
jgi:hypothetical protein